MIRIEGVPVVAERLQKALHPACQAGPPTALGKVPMNPGGEPTGVASAC